MTLGPNYFRGGGEAEANATSTWSDGNTYVYDSFTPVAGNINLAGSESWVVNSYDLTTRASNISSASISRSGTVRLNNGSGSASFGRNTTSGGVVYDYLGGTWAGAICGSYYWSTVPTAPGAIAVSSAGTIVNNTYQTAIALTASCTYTATPSSNTKATDGGQSVTSHQAEYRVTAAGKTVIGVSRSGTTVTVTTSGAHGFVSGNTIQLYGVSGTYASTVNGRWQVTGASTTQITFTTSTSGTFSVSSGDLTSALIALYGSWAGTKAVTGGTFSFVSLTAARYYQFRVYANNANGSSAARESASVFANPNPPAWGAKTLNTSITQSVSYSDYLDITGYTLSGPVTVDSGSLPTDLSIASPNPNQIDSNNARITISGVPKTVGTFTFRLRATNVGGSTLSPTYTLTVASSSTVWNSPGKGTLNNTDNTFYALRNEVAYNGTTGDYLYAIGAVTNGYSITSGSLPPGLTATNAVGTVNGASVNIFKITGTPTASGTYNFIVSVNVGSTITQAVSIDVRPTGKRFTITSISPYTTSTKATNITTLKRLDVSGWVDIRTLKKWNGTSWVDVDNPTS